MSYSELISLAKVFPLDQIISVSGYRYDGPYLVTAPDYLRLLDEIYTEDNIEGMKSLMLVKYILPCATMLDRETFEKYEELAGKYYGSSGTVFDEEWACFEVGESERVVLETLFITSLLCDSM